MNRLMRPTLLAFVVSLVVWGLVAVWDADPSAVSSWMLTWQRIAVDVAVVSGLVMLARLVYALGSGSLAGAEARRAVRAGSASRTFAELLIDCEEDRTLRAVLIGMLREAREAVAGQVDLRRRVWLVN